jgi:hypothetical protein
VSRPERRTGVVVWLLEIALVVGALLRHRRSPSGVDPEDLAAGYERGDMSPTVVLAAGVGFLLTLLVVFGLITALGVVLTGVPFTVGRPADLIGGLQAAPAPTPPAPRLEAQSGQALDPYRAAEQQRLSSYGWVDRQAGVAHMPIDRAMDLVAERGLPTRPTPSATPRDDGARAPSRASSGRVEEPYP